MPISLGTTTVTALFLGTTSITSAYLGATQVFGGSFTPLSLFSGGAQGIWLDPSDLSTMFSDRAGTIQVTTPGTVVGKRLDKSGRGNHALAPTDAARPIYGIEPKGGRRNLLTWSEDFGNGVWVKTAATVSATQYTAPDGTTTADLIIPTTASTAHNVSQSIFPDTTATRRLSVHLKAAGYSWVFLQQGSSKPGSTFNLSTGQKGTFDFLGGLPNPVITDLGDSWFRISFDVIPVLAQTSGVTVIVTNGDNVNNFAGDGTSGVLIWGAQLETGSTATNYQRVTTAYDITESGVATCHYVQYDGSDDSMSTAAIDFTATDKMSVFAAVRKLSDATRAMVAEISTAAGSNAGTFAMFAPDATGAAGDFGFFARGSATGNPTVKSAVTLAPVSAMLTGLIDIPGDLVTLRLNGTQVGQSTTDMGTGTFRNDALYIGRRGNASIPFNGKDYGIIIVGKAASAGEITDTETWLAAKTAQVTI